MTIAAKILMVVISVVSVAHAEMTNGPVLPAASVDWSRVAVFGTSQTGSADWRAPLPPPPDRQVAREVLRDVGVRDFKNETVIAWTAPLAQIIVQAQCGTNYVAIIASREADDSTNGWRIDWCRYRMKVEDGHAACIWNVGRREYSQSPTRHEIVALAESVYVFRRTPNFIFGESFE